jgi:hypothetical protein
MDDGENVATEAAHFRHDNRGDGRGGNRCVDRVASAHEDVEPGGRGQRVRRGHHAIGGIPWRLNTARPVLLGSFIAWKPQHARSILPVCSFVRSYSS